MANSEPCGISSRLFHSTLLVYVGGTEEKPEKPVISNNFLVRIPTEYILNTRKNCYCYTLTFGWFWPLFKLNSS
jgi:hypothetical protein